MHCSSIVPVYRMKSLSELQKDLGSPVTRRDFERSSPSWVQAYECGCELLVTASSDYAWLRVCDRHEALAGVGAKHKFTDELRESLSPNARILLTILLTLARPPNRTVSKPELAEFLR